MVGAGHGVRCVQGRFLFTRSTLEVVDAFEMVVIARPLGVQKSLVGQTRARSLSTFRA